MQETEFTERNKPSNTKVYRFIARMVVGLVLAILLGIYLDEKLNTMPLLTLGFSLYVIIGSLYLLVKEAGVGEIK